MKYVFRLVLLIVFVATAAPLAQQAAPPAPAASFTTATAGRELPKPNYDLAFRWTSTKIAKYVFSTSVTPHWLEFSDRFWYAYETPAGQKWWMVDPVKKTKTPLWDNAKLAAQLTRILRTPYDAEHLSVAQLRFFDNDTKIRFSVSLPRESKVVTASGAEMDGMKLTEAEIRQQQQGGRGGRGGGRGGGGVQQGGRAGGAGTTPAGNKTWWLEYDVATGTVVLNETHEPEPTNPAWAQVSPDKQTILFARGQNLFMMDAKNYAVVQKTPNEPTVVEVQLTTDGEEHYGYAPAQRGDSEDEQEQQGGQQTTQTTQTAAAAVHENDKKFGPRRRAVGVQWSQDHKKFSLQRTDARKVGDLWVINSLSNPRPRLETYKYGMPGEANQPQPELRVFDIAGRTQLKIKTEAFKDQNLGSSTLSLTNIQREKSETAPRWITATAEKTIYTRTSRDLKRVDVVEADTATGESRVIISERLNTYVETQPLRIITNATGGKELIHWSERDGWGHYYLYDIRGTLIRQLTQGEFVATGVVSVDEKSRFLYFHAVGREEGVDPYYQHLYRVNLDTGDLKLLTPGFGSHSGSMNDKATFAIDNWSRIDMAPESVLYDAAGNKILDLEKTDVSALLAAGFKPPEPFTVKADDGVTDLYGVMYKPFDFDPSKRYPIIEFVYPGPQTESVTKTFSPRQANVMLAQFGFIVIEVGNRGGHPQRSKWYHNYGYGNLRDYGLADKKAAVEQLAKRHPWIDSNLVGIYGHSGGGFMSTAAMFVYPDFFKVAVSTSGNHDNSVYNRAWSEKHDGVKEVEKDGVITFEYDIDKNQDLAKNLKGKLLLMTGDIDNNVHPANTFRVIDALIKANKRFDFHIIPGKRHGYADAGDWSNAIRADYFARHLLGWAPTDADIMELQREVAIKR
ncbi:MAG: DPP IV N-terminal domain-containing protein [Acidobacteria bacterium]|nr:DPP IV N-terminal domain-containing protein [Acidobacteriota bacterium]